jgi:hypothetical protein
LEAEWLRAAGSGQLPAAALSTFTSAAIAPTNIGLSLKGPMASSKPNNELQTTSKGGCVRVNVALLSPLFPAR